MKVFGFALLMLGSALGHAQQAVVIAAPQGVVNLTATALAEPQNDMLTMTLFTEIQEPDAARGAAKVNRLLETALALAKKYPAVTARSGGYTSYPVYEKANVLTGWRVRAEIVLESQAFPELGELAGKMQSSGLQLARMEFSLSRPARAALEKQLTQQALGQFQERAAFIAKTLGRDAFAIREISVQADVNVPPRPIPMFARGAAMSAATTQVPIEAGKAAVTVTVSGSIQLEQKK